MTEVDVKGLLLNHDWTSTLEFALLLFFCFAVLFSIVTVLGLVSYFSK